MKKVTVIYENSEILVIDKPAGLAVQGGAGVSHSLDEDLSVQLGYKIYLVHRLDKETFGLMVVAKSQQAASKWISLISGKQVRKEYMAVCFGRPLHEGKAVESGKITSPVKKGERELPAETNFTLKKNVSVEIPAPEVLPAEYSKPEPIELSLLHLVLGTGRMHQIRIHLAKYDCPIAGDDKHGNFKLNKLARKIGIKSLLLCSYRLTIPLDGKKQTFEAQLPESMIKYFGDDFKNGK